MNLRAPKIWLALLVVPVAALGYQVAAYALVPFACDRNAPWPLHALSGLVLLACLACTLLATGEWLRLRRAVPGGEDDDAAYPGTRNRFLAACGSFVGALFTLVIAAQWMAAVVISPCLQ
jgi:hypothetical protein